MTYESASDDELVFLVRQNNQEAAAALSRKMGPKQDRLIFKLLHENRACSLDHCDLKITAMLTLYQAVDAYDCRKAVFDAFYHLLLERELVNEMKRHNTNNHTLLNLAISLDEPLEDGGVLSDVIGCHDESIMAFTAQDILTLAEDASAGLTPLEKAVLAYRMLGYTYTEIGKIVKRNYRHIARIVASINRRHHLNPED